MRFLAAAYGVYSPFQRVEFGSGGGLDPANCRRSRSAEITKMNGSSTRTADIQNIVSELFVAMDDV